MSTSMMLPVAEHLERSGVDSVDIMSHACFDAAVRFVGDNPLERMRVLRRLMPTPALATSHSGSDFWGFKSVPPDVARLDLDLAIDTGVDRVRFVNGLLDFDPLVDSARHAKARGVATIGALVFSVSPVHTDALYECKAREIVERADVDWIMIKDSGGLLTPERAGSLVDAVRRGAGDKKVTLHGHSMTGLAHRVYMIGVEHGVDEVQCAIWPLALGTSQPSTQRVVRNLREEGYQVDVDDAEIEAASAYLTRLARAKGLPLGEAPEYDHFHYRHQVPGGMMSNLRAQLIDAGLLDRLDALLEETARVREELGWPTMVTPYSQFVGSQALLNVVHGERYRVVPDQIKKYVLGHYGKLLAPVDPDVLDKIMTNGSPGVAENPDSPAPVLDDMRHRIPGASDEELLLRALCPEDAVERVMAGDGIADDGIGPLTASDVGSIGALVGQLAERAKQGGEVVFEQGELRVRVKG
jgi:oxaloacetate decarboxylase alpha subunit